MSMESFYVSTFGCFKNTIKLRSGRYFDLKEPQQDQFTLRDIAGALSKICRFGGQLQEWYSVAEHSVNCATQAIKDGQCNAACKAVLMHDAAEAFIGDVVKPLKIMLPEYAEIENRVERVISDKFDIAFGYYKDVIRDIDHAMLIAERRQLFGSDGVKWPGEDSARVINLLPKNMYPHIAEEEFMMMAQRLGIAGD